MSNESLRFSPEILRRLGEELIPHVDQGIIELVRNAWDADAIECCVELIEADEPGGTLRVADTGVGMTKEDIRNGWLVLGRSGKEARKPTDLGRLPVGDKGLGRLAALRMGSVATLRTRPKLQPGREYSLVLDWARYDAADLVESVGLAIVESATSETPGTTIEVANLGIRLGQREVQRLARSLLLLADPFDDSTGFHPRLIAPAFDKIAKRVRDAYFDEAEYRLQAEIDEKGRASAQVFDRTGRVRWTAAHENLSKGPGKSAPPYKTSPSTFHLWMFNVAPQSFSPGVSVQEVRDWLEAVGGVHLYHRQLRVHPYGDPGHDWLDMNLARARSPELRPSTNTSIGRIVVPDPAEQLNQKTDRTGFIENEAFSDLKRFATDALDWMANERLSEREKRRAKERVDAPKIVSEAQARLEQAIKQLPAETRPAVQRAVRGLESAREGEARTLREDLQLYRTLGTVGTTAAVFAHESAKPVTQIEKMARTIETRAKKELGERYAALLGNPVELVMRSARALRTFAAFPLRFLAREKRRTARVDVHAAVSDVVELFEPFLTDARISTRLELVDETPLVRGSVAAIEAILANLLTNAINALDAEDAATGARDIVIRTELSGEGRLLLRVLDTGPGITRLSIDDIWLPGRTTRVGGTGLGLTIVRDTVTDLGGRVHVVARGDLGGAEFIVELPVVHQEGR